MTDDDERHLLALMSRLAHLLGRMEQPRRPVSTQDLVGEFELTQQQFAVATQYTQFAPADPARFALMVGVNSTGVFHISTDQNASILGGFVLQPSSSVFALNFRDHPGIVGAQWFYVNSTAGALLTAISVRYKPLAGRQ